MATTTAINFGSLVGAQLTALIEAEVEGAEKTSEFIESVGFEQAKNGSMRLRMVTFEMVRRDVDGVARTHSISVPVLTLVPIPLLTIEQADMEFDLNVESVQSVETKESSDSGQPAARRALFSKREKSKSVKLLTRLARTTQEDNSTSFDLKMKVKIAQSPFPLGIERLLNTADLSVEDALNE